MYVWWWVWWMVWVVLCHVPIRYTAIWERGVGVVAVASVVLGAMLWVVRQVAACWSSLPVRSQMLGLVRLSVRAVNLVTCAVVKRPGLPPCLWV